MFSSIQNYIVWLMASDKLLLIMTAVFIDQSTKYIFYDHHRWSHLLFFTPVFNHWVTGWYLLHKWLILIISIIALVSFYQLYRIRYITKVVYIFLIAGTLWNLLDRVILWWVRDFIDLQFFPVFNFADIYLTIAVLCMCWVQYQFFMKYKIKK